MDPSLLAGMGLSVTFAGASVLITLYLMRNDPRLLERRMRSGPRAERRPTQKFIMLATTIGFIALLVVPALDHRFGWSAVPLCGVLLGDVLVVVGSISCTSCIEKTHSHQRPSKSWKDRWSFLPDRMPSFATRGTRVEHSTYSAHRLHSARIGGWSRSGRRCRF
jgi:hypothetical protein